MEELTNLKRELKLNGYRVSDTNSLLTTIKIFSSCNNVKQNGTIENSIILKDNLITYDIVTDDDNYTLDIYFLYDNKQNLYITKSDLYSNNY